jgi:ribonuclease HI
MELRAAIEALNKLKEPCEVEFHTDSEYLRNGITKWIHGWKRKGWKRGAEEVKNADLWKALDETAARHVVKWNWVRGHSGQPENEQCDILAVAEIAKLRGKFSKGEMKDALKAFVAAREGSAP